MTHRIGGRRFLGFSSIIWDRFSSETLQKSTLCCRSTQRGMLMQKLKCCACMQTAILYARWHHTQRSAHDLHSRIWLRYMHRANCCLPVINSLLGNVVNAMRMHCTCGKALSLCHCRMASREFAEGLPTKRAIRTAPARGHIYSVQFHEGSRHVADALTKKNFAASPRATEG